MAQKIGDVELIVGVEDKASARMKTIGKSADKMAKGFAIAGTAMVAAGVAVVAALNKMVNAYSKAGDEVAKMAKRTGFTTESLSELRHVAQITGSELGTIEKATKKMAKTISDAGDGLATYVRAFEKLGLEVKDLEDLEPEEQFWLILEAMSALESQTIKTALAQDIFGRAGTALLPMMFETKEAIAELRQEAHELNLVFSAEAAAAAEEFEDSKTRLQGAMTGIGNTIAQILMPKFEEFIQLLTEKLKPAMAWLEEHPEVVEAFLKFGLIFIGAGGLLLTIATFVKLLNFAMIPALIRATLAFIALMAASGPAGWAVLAGSALAAGLAVKALGTTLGGLFDEPQTIQIPTAAGKAALGLPSAADFPQLNMPQMAFGGIVPGPLGAPIPIIAHGGEQFAGVGKSFGDTNISIGNFMGDEASLRAFADTLKEVMGMDTRRTSFSGVNRLGYFQGSSAP